MGTAAGTARSLPGGNGDSGSDNLSGPTFGRSFPRVALIASASPLAVEASVHLAQHGWAILDESSLTQRAARKGIDGLPHIGLVVIDDSQGHEQTVRRLENLLPTRFHWLAVVPRQGLRSARERTFVAQRCFDYFTDPVDWRRLADTMGHALGMLSLWDVYTLGHTAQGQDMVGQCEAMRALVESIRSAASSAAPLLVTGERGTGKHLVAQMVHAQSARAESALLAVNCAAVAQESLHGELFGLDGDAAGGTRRPGKIESARGGTLFLGDIEKLPFAQQTELLRFLREKTLAHGTASAPVDTRIIAATCANLNAEVMHGRFRADLLHALSATPLRLPALREREGDAQLLARYFLGRFATELNRKPPGFTALAQEAINLHAWPGNVSEMISRIRRAVVIAEGRAITAEDLGLAQTTGRQQIVTLEQARAQADVAVINSALARNRNRVSQVARELGISRVTLYRLLERYQIRVRPHRTPPV